MKIKNLLALTSLLLLCTLSFAHEFWLEPAKFWIAKNEKMRFDLMVGEDYTGEHSNGHKYKVVKLDHYGNGKKQDVRTHIFGDSLSSIDLSFATEGGHLIAFNNSSKFIELQAAQFNEYLRTEGLDEVTKLRQQRKDTLKPGREWYQRCVKTLIQVGKRTDVTYAINTGMKLEIIPAKNPYTQIGNGPITFKMLFDNKPLGNALVLAWHKTEGITTHETARSDKDGNVTFSIDPKGKWMISTVHMVPSQDNKQADWQSYWGSYTFGYQ